MSARARRGLAAVALAAIVFAAAGATLLVTRSVGGQAPLTFDEEQQCLSFMGTPGGGADQLISMFGPMPSPIASAVQDAYARANGPFSDMYSAPPQADLKTFLDEAYHKVVNDPQIIADCRAYQQWYTTTWGYPGHT